MPACLPAPSRDQSLLKPELLGPCFFPLSGVQAIYKLERERGRDCCFRPIGSAGDLGKRQETNTQLREGDRHEPSPRHGREGADEDDHPEPRTDLQTTGTDKTSTSFICSVHTYHMLKISLVHLATGPSSSGSCDAGTRRGKRLKASPNSDSGATAVSSTSTDSELARFGDMDVVATLAVARFHGEVTRRMDEVRQGPWMYRCLSLKTA